MSGKIPVLISTDEDVLQVRDSFLDLPHVSMLESTLKRLPELIWPRLGASNGKSVVT